MCIGEFLPITIDLVFEELLRARGPSDGRVFFQIVVAQRVQHTGGKLRIGRSVGNGNQKRLLDRLDTQIATQFVDRRGAAPAFASSCEKPRSKSRDVAGLPDRRPPLLFQEGPGSAGGRLPS